MSGTQLSAAWDRYDLGTNVREDLMDAIFLVSREETPFLSTIGKQKANSNYVEWMTDSLASPAANAWVDGFTFSADTPTATLRMGNYCQISAKQLRVTRRADIVDKAGRKSEMARLVTKKGVELKRDIEYTLLSNTAAAVGTATAAPTTAGYPAWIRTNDSRSALGSPADPTLSSSTYGYPNAAATDGTDRALSEAYITDVIRSCWTNGGKPNILMMGPQTKTQFSKYMFTSNARIATPYQDHGANKKSGLSVVGAVDVYVSDFGAFDIVPNYCQPREDDLFVIDPEYWAVAWLTPITMQEIGKSGDAVDKMLVADYALVCKNQAASGIVADIDETLAMTS